MTKWAASPIGFGGGMQLGSHVYFGSTDQTPLPLVDGRFADAVLAIQIDDGNACLMRF